MSISVQRDVETPSFSCFWWRMCNRLLFSPLPLDYRCGQLSTIPKDKTSLVQQITYKFRFVLPQINKTSLGFTSECRQMQSLQRFLNWSPLSASIYFSKVSLGNLESVWNSVQWFKTNYETEQISCSLRLYTLERAPEVAPVVKWSECKQIFLSKDLLTAIPNAAHFLPNRCRIFCQKGMLTAADTYSGQKTIPAWCSLPWLPSAVELTDIFLSNTLQPERNVHLQVPVSPHPLSVWGFFVVVYYSLLYIITNKKASEGFPQSNTRRQCPKISFS